MFGRACAIHCSRHCTRLAWSPGSDSCQRNSGAPEGTATTPSRKRESASISAVSGRVFRSSLAACPLTAASPSLRVTRRSSPKSRGSWSMLYRQGDIRKRAGRDSTCACQCAARACAASAGSGPDGILNRVQTTSGAATSSMSQRWPSISALTVSAASSTASISAP